LFLLLLFLFPFPRAFYWRNVRPATLPPPFCHPFATLLRKKRSGGKGGVLPPFRHHIQCRKEVENQASPPLAFGSQAQNHTLALQRIQIALAGPLIAQRLLGNRLHRRVGEALGPVLVGVRQHHADELFPGRQTFAVRAKDEPFHVSTCPRAHSALPSPAVNPLRGSLLVSCFIVSSRVLPAARSKRAAPRASLWPKTPGAGQCPGGPRSGQFPLRSIRFRS